MKLTGNTVFITGGGSGIGRGLAEAFHKRGNQVIISDRRKGHLAGTIKANPGMQSIEVNVANPASIAAVARKLIAEYPKLNVLINNAGIMLIDDAAGLVDEELLVPTIATNLLDPLRKDSTLTQPDTSLATKSGHFDLLRTDRESIVQMHQDNGVPYASRNQGFFAASLGSSRDTTIEAMQTHGRTALHRTLLFVPILLDRVQQLIQLLQDGLFVAALY